MNTQLDESVNPTIWTSQRQHLGLVYVKQSYLSESIYRRNLRLQQLFFVFSRFALFFARFVKASFFRLARRLLLCLFDIGYLRDSTLRPKYAK